MKSLYKKLIAKYYWSGETLNDYDILSKYPSQICDIYSYIMGKIRTAEQHSSEYSVGETTSSAIQRQTTS